MTFGKGEEGRIDDLDEMQRMLDLFKSKGFDELDTARMYSDGDSERCLAKLNANANFKVATKAFPFKPGMHRPELLRKQFEESLANLQTDSVHIFYLHAPDHATPFEETLKEVNALYLEGKFQEFGLSNYAAWSVMEIWYICKTNRYVLPTVYQGRYNALSRDVEPELFPCLTKLGIRFYAYNPLLGGLLNAQLTIDSLPEDGRFRINSIQGTRYRERYWKDVYFEAVEDIKQVCSQNQISTVEASLRWIMNHSQLSTKRKDAVILGASSYTHLEDNLRFCNLGPLPQNILETFDACWKKVQPYAPAYGR